MTAPKDNTQVKGEDMPQPKDQPVDELNVAMWRLEDLETTILDASPEELPKLHPKLQALVTDLPEAVKKLCQAECNRAREEGRDETHKLYEREMKHLKDFQEAVVSREALKIEPVKLCAACSQQLMKEGE